MTTYEKILMAADAIRRRDYTLADDIIAELLSDSKRHKQYLTTPHPQDDLYWKEGK